MRVTIITGASRGIGLHLAQHYVDQGHTVLGCSRESSPFSALNYSHFLLDIADEDAVMAFFSEVRRTFGKVDNLVNNAGIGSMNHALLTPLLTLKRVCDVNLGGTFLFCREAAKLMMKEEYGRIVNFSTVAVPLRLAGEAAYVASKAAIEALTDVLARELAPFNITVNVVGPAPVKTDLIAHVAEKKLEDVLHRQAITRYAQMRDISNAVDFYLKPESSFITGQRLYLGGVL